MKTIRIRHIDGRIENAEIPPGCQLNDRFATAWVGHERAYRVRRSSAKHTVWNVIREAK